MWRGQRFTGLWRALTVLALLAAISFFAAQGQTSADTLTSPDYSLSPAVGDSFGGNFSSSNYSLVDSGGEAAIGDGSGGSYKLGAGFVAELQHSINLYVEPAGLVGYWPMNEGAGDTIHDASGNSNDGAISGGSGWVAGKIGDALQFSGSNYVSVPNNPAFKPTSALTVSWWVNPANINSSSEQKFISDTDGGGFASSVTGSATDVGCPIDSLCVFLYVSGGYKVVSVTKSVLSNNEWAHISATYDGGALKLYVNGNQVGSTAVSGAITENNSNVLCIGAEADGGTCSGANFQGDIDDVKIYNRALSDDEITANYQAGLDGLDSGLVIPPLQAGQSQIVDADVIVEADAPYSLLTRETGLLTNVSSPSITIPSIGSTIANPAAWNEATTSGLGFTILSGPDGVPSQWNNGANYAAVPLAATAFYNRTGFSGGAKDIIGLQYRLGVSSAQVAGQYQNNIVYTATMTP